MFQSTDIVKKIFYINLFAFLFTLIGQNLFRIPIIDYLALYPINSPDFHVYQLITHMFMHGGLAHIFFNMFAFIQFGPEVENNLGSRKFLLFYILMGLGATFTQMAVASCAMIGASGAIFGVLVYFTLLNPNDKIGLFFLPIYFKTKHFMYFVLGMEILSAFFITDGVAHWAHLGGALTGLILYLLDRKYQFDI